MSLESKIVSLATERKVDDLVEIKNELTLKRMKMDKFFTMFLDKFERKMHPEKLNTPVWNLYRKQLKEYEGIQRALTMTNYYLEKHNVQKC
jgi:hypothetical protein